MRKTPAIWGPDQTVRLKSVAIKDKLAKIAYEQDRSLASLVRLIVEEWLQKYEQVHNTEHGVKSDERY